MSLGDKLRKDLGTDKLPQPLKVVLRPEILLSGNIPKPLHGLAPRVVLGAKWWEATRRAAYASTGYRCLACGVWKHQAQGRQWLEGHELYQIDYANGRMTYLETVPLCHFCHNYIHDGRMRALLERGELHQAKFVAVLQYGDRVLADAGLRKPTFNEREKEAYYLELEGKIAEWGKWRLVINGKEYKPKYKTYEAWRRAHGDE